MPIEMYGRNYVCFFLFKVHFFPKMVPSHLLNHFARHLEYLSNGLKFISLSRAIPEIIVNKNVRENSYGNAYWNAWAKLCVFSLFYFIILIF